MQLELSPDETMVVIAALKLQEGQAGAAKVREICASIRRDMELAQAVSIHRPSDEMQRLLGKIDRYPGDA